MSWLSNIFKKKKVELAPISEKQVKPSKQKEVLNYKELAKIAEENAKLIQGNINQAQVMLNGLGSRKGKKYKTRIENLKKKLEEELFYADYYSAPYKYHAEGVQSTS